MMHVIQDVKVCKTKSELEKV